MLCTVEEPLTLEFVGPSIIPSIGERVTISCTATVVLGVIHLPVLTLTHPNGTNLSSTVGTQVSVVLDPAHVRDAGEYTCTGMIDLEDIMAITVQAKRNFTFKCKFIRTNDF